MNDATGEGLAEVGRAEQARRRRRREAVFGDVLPDRTSDERSPQDGQPATGRDTEGDPGEEWLRRQVPPHHG